MPQHGDAKSFQFHVSWNQHRTTVRGRRCGRRVEDTMREPSSKVPLPTVRGCAAHPYVYGEMHRSFQETGHTAQLLGLSPKDLVRHRTSVYAGATVPLREHPQR
jgi:hypothetical protein